MDDWTDIMRYFVTFIYLNYYQQCNTYYYHRCRPGYTGTWCDERVAPGSTTSGPAITESVTRKPTITTTEIVGERELDITLPSGKGKRYVVLSMTDLINQVSFCKEYLI